MNTRKMPEPLLTSEEAAALLGVTPRALQRLRSKKHGDRGPVVTYVGRFPRYSRRSITAYLTTRARGGLNGK